VVTIADLLKGAKPIHPPRTELQATETPPADANACKPPWLAEMAR